MQIELMHENKKFDKPKLLHLDLETSSICNFNCAMCPRPKENGQMHLADIKSIIRQFVNMGGETIKPFWRGEPFCDKRMPEILEYAKSLGLKTMINTNGSDPHGIYKDCLSFIDWISFSIDEQHNNINSDSLDAIELALSSSGALKHIEIQACNINECMINYCISYNLDYKVDRPTKRSDTDTDSEVITGERKYCGFLDWRLIIDYKGNAHPCCVDWDSEIDLGNIFENSLKDIFYSAHMEELRHDLKNDLFANDICKKCPSRSAYK